MIAWFPVRSRSLGGRALVAGGERIERAAILPFFDVGGAVRKVVVLSAQHDLRIATPESLAVAIPWVGPLRLSLPLPELALLEDNAAELEALWHFDAAWVMRSDEHREHPLAEMLQQANAVAELQRQSIDEVYFDRQLRRIRYARRRTKDGYNLVRWSDSLLPPLPASDPYDKPEGELRWKLRPFWE